jgi:hypothetical protein
MKNYCEGTSLLLLAVCFVNSFCRIEAFQNNRACFRQHASVLSSQMLASRMKSSRLTPFPREPTFHRVSLSSENYERTNETGGDYEGKGIGPIEAFITKFTMMAYIASMCVALPITLLPVLILYKTNIVSKAQSEHMSLQTGQFCARFLLQLMPFVNLKVMPHQENEDPQPSIWVANHVSQLDTFLFLAADVELRGPNKRPIKTVYVSVGMWHLA